MYFVKMILGLTLFYRSRHYYRCFQNSTFFCFDFATASLTLVRFILTKGEGVPESHVFAFNRID